MGGLRIVCPISFVISLPGNSQELASPDNAQSLD
jgi:hypothetical protein